MSRRVQRGEEPQVLPAGELLIVVRQFERDADALVVVGPQASGSLPHTAASPPWPRSRPMSSFWVVDFPAPLGPRKPNISPLPTAKPMPRTAGSVDFG